MSNPVLEETGRLSLSIPITLVHFDSTLTQTRGVIARLPQTEGQLDGAFSESARNCWTSTPSNQNRVRYVRAGDPATGIEHQWVVNDIENYGGAIFGSTNIQTTRYQLFELDSTEIPAVVHIDFSPADFLSTDFN